MGARKHGKGKDDNVKGRQIIPGAMREAGRKDDDCDGHYLNGRIELTQPRRPEAAESGHDIDGGRSDHDKDVPTDNCYGDPKRDR